MCELVFFNFFVRMINMCKQNVRDKLLETIHVYIQELNKAERMVASGKLSKQSIEKLLRSGAIRDKKRFLKGIVKGNINIEKSLKKYFDIFRKEKSKQFSVDYGITISGKNAAILKQKKNPVKSNILKFLSVGRNYLKNEFKFQKFWGLTGLIKQLITPKDKIKKDFRKFLRDIVKNEKEKAIIDAIISKRHELDELRDAKKLFQTALRKNVDLRKSGLGSIQFINHGLQVGAHVSPKVLEREKQLMDYIKNAFGIKTNLMRYREKSGEYDLIDKLGKSGVDKLRRKIINQILRGKNVSLDVTTGNIEIK